ncbi:TackOD1 domain-containing metal-binding protein [Paenimyroides baculatum]|uniref:Thaumarchaeal output domain-containing protein n=1 Tax=Paenimyroides baculatum TaxID=2608000 RepID=A0A5M6CDZ5_9FLAO|nr:hypothetical protein [Paenimyroides baculatum]KAA5532072.1 hypothetical protein F0460_13760 [Paenimyroides baculatum]
MTDTVIEIHGKKVLLLEHAIEHDVLPDPCSTDIWVINHSDEWLVRRFLRRIVRSKNIKIYLKPVFLQKEFKKFYATKDNHLKYLSDGYIKGLDIIEKIPLIEQISFFVSKYADKRNYENFTENDFFIQKTFDYYYTRKKRITPVLKHKSLTGYSYPRIETYFYNNREAFINSRMLLQEAFTNNWLTRHYVDTSHLCHKCSSGFLNYREICPKCSHHNLKASNLIHHFRCAYVGVEKDFIFKDKMVCPKCSSELRNLGVDYDRPGKIFNCKNKKCQHEFQDAPVGVHCVDCETEQAPHELVVRKIYEYEITAQGMKIGLHL